MGGHTGDVLVKNVIFLEDIVDDLFGVLVDDQDHPLLRRQSQLPRPFSVVVLDLTSLPVSSLILSRITGGLRVSKQAGAGARRWAGEAHSHVGSGWRRRPS